jgi:hypothetical protein
MIYKLIWIYFFIGFISDIVLNYLSRQNYVPASIKALKVYFLRKSIKNATIRDLISAVNAGLTIVSAILLTMFLSYGVFNFAHPRTLSQLYRFLVLAFPIGYLMDIIIEKTELFGPTLKPFYKEAGAGFWGAAAFIFSILIAYMVSVYAISCRIKS